MKFLLLTATVFLAGQALAADQRTDQGGVTASLRYTEQGGGAARVQIGLTDSASGAAIQGARPAAWMLMRRSELVSAERSCEDKARALVSGSLGSRADVDLNSYRLVTLNHDQTLAFINPHVGLQRSKLESIVSLPGTGYDWVHAPDAGRLFVSLRDAGGVAMVDTTARKLVAVLPTGTGSLPTRMALDDSARRVWVGLDGERAVLALDAASGAELARVPVARGLHTVTAGTGTRWIFATHSKGSSVTVIDSEKLVAVHEVAVGETPVDSAWSEAAQRLAVLSINGARLDLVDPVSGRVTAAVPLARGAQKVGLFDGGRRALVVNGQTQTVSLIDLANARLVAEVPVPGSPDQLAFSREFAYVRSQASTQVHVINLAQARQGTLAPVAVAMGRSAPAELPEALNVAGVMAPAPEGNGMLVANPGDGLVYRYAEGMMVPVGSFSNYRRAARGLMVLDSSLTERTPGQFEAVARAPLPGRYDVVVRNQQPALLACFTVDLQEGATAELAGPAVPAPRLRKFAAAAGDTAMVHFSWHDAQGQPLELDDVVLLAVRRRGQWQVRLPARREGDGLYAVTLARMQPGEFEILVRSETAGVPFDQGRLGRLNWPLPTPAGAAP